ncbi:AAA family ATPase, partial [Bacteroides acidifaciens]
MTITTEMKTALDLIENTKQPVYITGKAGTGKTTLLRYIVSSIKKRFVITASTGIAAVNAGGVTLHSLLHIPFGCLNESTNMGGLPPNKVKLINNIDAIIIDEISMVRPDVLDFIDRKLRAYRVSDKPFGGLQLIMFGDLYQLPPVVKAEEQTILNQFYKGPYFFYAKVFKEIGFTMVELTHIF